MTAAPGELGARWRLDPLPAPAPRHLRGARGSLLTPALARPPHHHHHHRRRHLRPRVEGQRGTGCAAGGSAAVPAGSALAALRRSPGWIPPPPPGVCVQGRMLWGECGGCSGRGPAEPRSRQQWYGTSSARQAALTNTQVLLCRKILLPPRTLWMGGTVLRGSGIPCGNLISLHELCFSRSCLCLP